MPKTHIGTPLPLIHWVENACFMNNFVHILIASEDGKGSLKLKYLMYQWIRLFIESKNIFVSFLCKHEFRCLFTLLLNVTLSMLF